MREADQGSLRHRLVRLFPRERSGPSKSTPAVNGATRPITVFVIVKERSDDKQWIPEFEAESLTESRRRREMGKADQKKLHSVEDICDSTADMLARLLSKFTWWKQRIGAGRKCAPCRPG